MTLYSKDGSYPQPLPDRDTSGEGLGAWTWTDLVNNEAGRAACGWTEAPEAPTYDPETASLSWTDGAWLVTPFSAEQLAARLDAARITRLADLASLRWDRQQSFLYAGTPMPADADTITFCNAAEAYARNKGLDFDAPRKWKVRDGVFTTLTTNEIIAYGCAIGDHMQACFDREDALTTEILVAPDLASLRSIDISSGWPA